MPLGSRDDRMDNLSRSAFFALRSSIVVTRTGILAPIGRDACHKIDLVERFLITIVCALAWVAQTQEAPIVWGGDHIEMEVTRAGARLEFDCAHGTIDEPLRADPQGAFKLKGTFTPERGGPTRDDNAPAPKATYSGTINETAMSLKVVVEGGDAQGTSYELTRDRRGNVRKCR
jgi:hypothetical protein